MSEGRFAFPSDIVSWPGWVSNRGASNGAPYRFWIIWSPTGLTPPRHIFWFHNAALKAARQMGTRYPDQVFYVCAAQGVISKASFYTRLAKRKKMTPTTSIENQLTAVRQLILDKCPDAHTISTNLNYLYNPKTDRSLWQLEVTGYVGNVHHNFGTVVREDCIQLFDDATMLFKNNPEIKPQDELAVSEAWYKPLASAVSSGVNGGFNKHKHSTTSMGEGKEISSSYSTSGARSTTD